MNPIIILVIQCLLKYGPDLAREVVALFSVKEPSNDDWEKIFAIADKSYDDYVHPAPTVTVQDILDAKVDLTKK